MTFTVIYLKKNNLLKAGGVCVCVCVCVCGGGGVSIAFCFQQGLS